MFKERRKIGNKYGFTLVELMTVLVILGIIMGIGVPKYLRIQAQAEYDADVKTITGIAQAAETYAAQKNLGATSIKLKDPLIAKKIIDGTIVLNRKNSSGTSVKNTAKTTLSSGTDVTFTIDGEGQVTNLSANIIALIGNTLY